MPSSALLRCDIDCETCHLGPHTIYGPLIQANPHAMRAARKGMALFRAHQTIIRAGEVSDFVYTIYSGWALCGVVLPDGRRQIITFLLPGDTVCFAGMFKRPTTATVKALTDVRLCVFAAQDMHERLFGVGGLRKAFDDRLSERLTDLTHRLTDIGQRRASGRLAQLILNIDARLRANGLSINGAFDFPPRQEHIADALGLTPVHVNRTLAQLRHQGAIDFSKGRMEILDYTQLRKIAEED